MAKRMELSLQIDYVHSWDGLDGIREIISNALDAQTQFDAKMEVDWYQNPNAKDPDKRIGTLRIENTGTTLPREALLLGYTTKRESSDTIGRHAEGLKTGALALLRAGHSVTIRTGSEVWEPTLEESSNYKAKVLVFYINEDRKFENRVRIEIGGVSKEVWEELSKRFLFLDENVMSIKTQYGSLLLGPKYAGKIYVKGIWVQNTQNTVGYDVICDLDRDRKMVDSFDLRQKIGYIWDNAISMRPDLLDIYWGMFDSQAEDIEGISQYNAPYMRQDLLTGIAAKFAERYGKDAVPVSNIEESKDIEHLGKRGVVVTKQLQAVLTQTMGSFANVKESLRKETKRMYSWSELSATEQTNVAHATDLLHQIEESVTLADIDIVDFASPDLQGLYKDGRIQVRHDFLSEPAKLLQILIHETAHKLGGNDGDKSHVQNIEQLWMKAWAARAAGSDLA